MQAILVDNLPSLSLTPKLPILHDLLRNLLPTKLFLETQDTIGSRSSSRQERQPSQPSSEMEVIFAWCRATDVPGFGKDGGDIVEDEGSNGSPGFLGFREPDLLRLADLGRLGVDGVQEAVELELRVVERCEFRCGGRILLERLLTCVRRRSANGGSRARRDNERLRMKRPGIPSFFAFSSSSLRAERRAKLGSTASAWTLSMRSVPEGFPAGFGAF